MKDINDQDFKQAVLLGLQVASTHLCALALASRMPNPNYRSDTVEGEDTREYIPLSQSAQMYHAGAQQQLNVLIDELVGTAEEAAEQLDEMMPFHGEADTGKH